MAVRRRVFQYILLNVTFVRVRVWNRCGGRVIDRAVADGRYGWGGVHRSGYGWSVNGSGDRCGRGDHFRSLANLSHETVNVVGCVRHGPDGTVRFGQAVLSLDHSVGQALFGRLVVTGGRVGHAVLVSVRRIWVYWAVHGGRGGDVSGRGVSHGGVHYCGTRIILSPGGDHGDAREAHCYL